MKIRISDLDSLLNRTSFQKDGHEKERKYACILSDSFSNFEYYWKWFIVPQTNRIDLSFIEDANHLVIDPRKNVDAELHEIGSYHYSIFLNFLFAQKSFEVRQISFFENFYTHLGCICDSVEEFLIKVYLITLECDNKLAPLIDELSKEEFLRHASDWYDKKFKKAYQIYLSKGKVSPLKYDVGEYLLNRYFQNSEEWVAYKVLSSLIRQFRNVIVHGYQIAYIPKDGKHYVPKKEKVQDYKQWMAVGNSVESQPKFLDDFIVREEQMSNDIEQLKGCLQDLWLRPIADMKQRLYVDKNPILLGKYNLTFI